MRRNNLLSLKAISLVVIAVFAVFTISSCNWSNTAKGGTIGAGAGGAIGGAIGSASGNTATGAIIGAVVGGAAGATIGRYMDKQVEEMQEDIEGAEIERVGEGIKITFDSGLLFDTDKSALKPATKENLNNLAETLQKYEDTKILVEGHTDDLGSSAYNLNLSIKRVEKIRQLMLQAGADDALISLKGYGEEKPIVPNTSEENREINRRIEFKIFDL